MGGTTEKEAFAEAEKRRREEREKQNKEMEEMETRGSLRAGTALHTKNEFKQQSMSDDVAGYQAKQEEAFREKMRQQAAEKDSFEAERAAMQEQNSLSRQMAAAAAARKAALEQKEKNAKRPKVDS